MSAANDREIIALLERAIKIEQGRNDPRPVSAAQSYSSSGLSMSGFLRREDVGGVPFASLTVAFDVAPLAKCQERIRIHDDVFKGHPCRQRLLRVAFESFKPIIESFGKRVLIVHECDEGLVILTGEHEDGEAVESHSNSPLEGC